MMSPQASFAYKYGYGHSPQGHGSRSTPRPVKKISEKNTPPVPTLKEQRESPSTVDTTAETDSVVDAAAVP